MLSVMSASGFKAGCLLGLGPPLCHGRPPPPPNRPSGSWDLLMSPEAINSNESVCIAAAGWPLGPAPFIKPGILLPLSSKRRRVLLSSLWHSCMPSSSHSFVHLHIHSFIHSFSKSLLSAKSQVPVLCWAHRGGEESRLGVTWTQLFLGAP